MKYTDLAGALVDSEVWCPGPEHDTVWTVNGAVVKLKTREEIAYDAPTFEHIMRHSDRQVLAFADWILRRHWQSDDDIARYRRRVGLDVPEPPTAEELDLARTFVAQYEKGQRERKLVLAAHTASTPVSVTRLRELADEIECSEMVCSVE